MLEKGNILCKGRAVGTKVAAGSVRVITDPSELQTFQDGEILVADTTTPGLCVLVDSMCKVFLEVTFLLPSGLHRLGTSNETSWWHCHKQRRFVVMCE